MSTSAFYDELSGYYHLVYADWQASIIRQAQALDSIIRSEGGPGLRTILDCSCGIGTQSLGLAARGYEVAASDLSAAAVERARSEARQRGLSLQVSVATRLIAKPRPAATQFGEFRRNSRMDVRPARRQFT